MVAYRFPQGSAAEDRQFGRLGGACARERGRCNSHCRMMRSPHSPIPAHPAVRDSRDSLAVSTVTVPLGSWETITFVAALRHNKMTAPMVIEGAMTGEMFLVYIEQCLVPTLRRNDIVVMDNCRVHMAPAVRQAIEKAKSVRYLPKYSPDLNPIELPYSKFKAYLRKVAA
jgi:transposase